MNFKDFNPLMIDTYNKENPLEAQLVGLGLKQQTIYTLEKDRLVLIRLTEQHYLSPNEIQKCRCELIKRIHIEVGKVNEKYRGVHTE